MPSSLNNSSTNSSSHNSQVFRLHRLRYNELWQDAVSWIKRTYQRAGEKFSTASPFAQLLSVILHMSRMIFYYIEDSISGLNIRTSYRPEQIKGLATLTGHDPGRSISARGAIRITYIETGNNEHANEICYISNKSQIYNSLNGLSYIVLFSSDNAKITMTQNNYVEASIIQGNLKYQQSTGDGSELQSFNFTERNQTDIDQYFVNVYVNGERWDTVNSLLDMGYDQKACIVRTGANSGIDIFFGNGTMGAIPQRGAIILIEYVCNTGSVGNLPKEAVNSTEYWEWKTEGFLQDGTSIDLNNNFKISCLTDIIFGTPSENTALTQLIAPYTSRSFVLASQTNYEYFLKKMNMFSVIEVVPGYYANKNSNVSAKYEQASSNFSAANQNYELAVSTYGINSTQAAEAESALQRASDALSLASENLYDTEMNDNTVYLMLIPDISNRISSATNYFTCDESLFSLTIDEQYNILNLIEMSGQRCLTIENKILQARYPRFAINIDARIWEDFSYDGVYNDCISVLSQYFINLTRRDRIPLSDIVAILESVSGIDSVKVAFDADVNNTYLYNRNTEFYGIDDYGDIEMSREVQDSHGNSMIIHDLYPLFRGGFTSPSGISYSSIQSQTELSGFNLNIIGTSSKSAISITSSRSSNY